MTEEMKLLPGEVKQLKNALIILTIAALFSSGGGVVITNLLFFLLVTFVLRYLNRNDYIARRDVGVLVVAFFVTAFVGKVISSTLIALNITNNKPINYVVFVLLIVFLVYGWIAYFRIVKSKTLIASVEAKTEEAPATAASQSNSVETEDDKDLSVEVSADSVEIAGDKAVSSVASNNTAAQASLTPKFCPMCGVELTAGACFCAYCGSKIK